jgi:hypothetical protein
LTQPIKKMAKIEEEIAPMSPDRIKFARHLLRHASRP